VFAAGSAQVWRAAGRVSPLSRDGERGFPLAGKTPFNTNLTEHTLKPLCARLHADRAFNQ
jgi:hypothetical protein